VPRHAREGTSRQGQQEDKRKEEAKDLKKIGIGLLFLPPSKTRQEVYSERGLGAGGAGERSEVMLIAFKSRNGYQQVIIKVLFEFDCKKISSTSMI
jgi:hypothetical protein